MAFTYLPVILPAGTREAQPDQKAKLKGGKSTLLSSHPITRHV
jgi:hypothetical protein